MSLVAVAPVAVTRDAGPPRAVVRPWRRALAWLAFLGPFFYLSYGLANYLASVRAHVPSVVFEWERGLPFWAWTIFPYWSINAFYAVSVFLCISKHELDRHALRLLTAQVLAVAFFIATPLGFSFGQPVAGGAAGWLFGVLRGFDKPFNQAPSLHIALAVILWDFYRRRLASRGSRWMLHSWAFVVCASVLTAYQHHFIDIPTGAVLGLICVWLWPLERQAPPWAAWNFTHDPQRTRVGLFYAAGSIGCFGFALAFGGIALWLAWVGLALLLVALNYLMLGARGFAKRRDGKTSWALRWLLAPYRIGAWLNSRWWTRGQPQAAEVAPGVWVGRLPGRDPQAPWASAVDLAAELDAPHTLPTVSLPALDLVVPSGAWLLRAARAIERQRARHGSVLVFCALGYSRSAAAAATWLLLTRRAATPEEALKRIRAARPHAVLAAPLCAAVARASRLSGGEG